MFRVLIELFRNIIVLYHAGSLYTTAYRNALNLDGLKYVQNTEASLDLNPRDTQTLACKSRNTLSSEETRACPAMPLLPLSEQNYIYWPIE